MTKIEKVIILKLLTVVKNITYQDKIKLLNLAVLQLKYDKNKGGKKK